MAYLTRKEAMERLHIGDTKMWKLTSAKKIPFYQDGPGGRMLFDEADLDAYMKSTRVEPFVAKPYATIRKRRASA